MDTGPKIKQPRTLTLDVEVSPLIAYSWGPTWETNLIEVIEQGQIISYSAKWLDGKHITKGLIDYKGYKPGIVDDKEIIKDIWSLLNEASVLVVQNGRAFDVKYINSRFLFHKMPPPKPYDVVDTKNEAKKYLRLPSYSLDSMCDYYGIGKKEEHEGFPLWKKCMAGDRRAWKKMKSYNAHDVVLTEHFYLKLRPFMKTHPNYNLLMGTELRCRVCGNKDLMKQGRRATLGGIRQQFTCRKCNAWSSAPLKDEIVKGIIR